MNQIDHVVINNKRRRSLKDMHTCRVADAGSDHYLVMFRLKLCLRKTPVKKNRPRKYHITNNGLAPDYISALATPYVPHRQLRSANNNILFVPKTHLHYGDITFTVSAAKMWNHLPTVIKLSGNVYIFKKNLKNPFIYPSSGLN